MINELALHRLSKLRSSKIIWVFIGACVFLALPTIIAATVYETWKARGAFTDQDYMALGLGMLISFLVAWAVIAVFLTYVQRHTLRVFAYYRIILGVLVMLVVR